MDWYIGISLCDARSEGSQISNFQSFNFHPQTRTEKVSNESVAEKAIEFCSRFILRFVVKIGVHLPIKLLAKPRGGLVSDHQVTTAGSRARTSRLSP